MSAFSHLALQRALYEEIAGDSGISALVSGVFDHVPQDTDYPYITLGEMIGRDWSTKTSNGMEFSVILNVYARERGRKAAAEIMELIHDLLHDGTLTVTGNQCVMIRFQSSDIRQELDGLTYRGAMRFQVLLQTN